VLLPLSLIAQDNIITQNNDTIDCKIVEVGNSTIRFETTTKGVKLKGEIDRAEVKGYSFSDPIAQKKGNPIKRGRKLSTDLQKIQLGVSVGYSKLTGSTTSAENQLVNHGFDFNNVRESYSSFKKGAMIGVSAHSLFLNNKSGALGWGVDYMFDKRSQKISGYAFENSVHIWCNYDQTVYTNYVALSFIAIKNIARIPKLHFYIDESVGVNFYRNELIYFNSPRLITAFSFGTMTKYGFLFDITPDLLIDVNALFFNSMYSTYRMTTGYSSDLYSMENTYEQLSKGIVSIGLKYNFTKKQTK
jgi:hypothetical protein